MKIFFLVLIILCIVACSDRKPRHTGELPVIDVIGNMNNLQRVYMSDLFSSIELIPLETREDCLLDFGNRPLLNDSIIIMIGDNFRRLFAFDRTTGEFLNQIGGQGQGPQEFVRPGCTFFSINNPTVFVTDRGRFLEYNFNGRYIRSFQRPELERGEILRFNHIGENLFIGSIGYMGDNEYKYFVIDDNGNIIQRFPNHIVFNMQGRWASSATGSGSSISARVDNRLYFNSSLNDTLFVFENYTLQPAYIFDLGRSLPLEYLETRRTVENLGSIHFPNLQIFDNFVATPRFFFYDILVPLNRPERAQRTRMGGSLFFYGMYDRATGVNIILDTDQHLQQGFVNDINGGLSFIPRFYAGNGEVVGVWNPEDMLELLTEEYFASKTIRDPEAHQRLREVLRNLVWDDNPVIVVATLKEN